MDIEFDDVNRIVFVTIFGDVGITDIIELINHGVSLGEKHNCYKMLYNMQEAVETASFLESYEFHKNLIQMTSLTYYHCFAVIFSPLKTKRKNSFTKRLPRIGDIPFLKYSMIWTKDLSG